MENGAQVNVSHSTLLVQGNSYSSTPSIIRVTGSGSQINAATANTPTSADGMIVRVSSRATDSVARLEILDQASLATDNLCLGDGSAGNSGTLLISGSASNLTAKQIKLYDPVQAQSLTVANNLTITNANLSITLSNTFSASLNDVFTVVGYGSRTGTFAGLADLDTFQAGGYTFEIQYNASGITLRTQLLEGRMPAIDVHEIIALIAPRAYLDILGLNDGHPAVQRQRVLMLLKIASLYDLCGEPENFGFYCHGQRHSVRQESRALLLKFFENHLGANENASSVPTST